MKTYIKELFSDLFATTSENTRRRDIWNSYKNKLASKNPLQSKKKKKYVITPKN